MFTLMLYLFFIGLSVGLCWYLVQAKNKMEQKKLEQFSQTLLSVIQEHGVDMKPGDIRIQLKDKKSVDYILDVYEGRDVVMAKTIEKNLQHMVQEKFPNYHIRVSTEFKKSGRKNSRTM